MIKNKGMFLVFIISLILFSGLISATIEITQPLEKYNFGDTIYTTVTITTTEVSGNFEINLICNGNSVNLYKISPASSAFSANHRQEINHAISLSREFIGNLSGECYLYSFIGAESVYSNHFKLSSLIDVKASTDKYTYKPGEKIILTVNSEKANGLMLNGFADISGAYSGTEVVSNGVLVKMIELANDSLPGEYQLSLVAYDEKSGSVFSNSGIATLTYEVQQVPTKIDISTLSEEATPGEAYEFVADLLDQAGNAIEVSLSATLTSPNNEKTLIELNSAKTGSIEIPKNMTAGKYIISVTYSQLTEEKSFVVPDFPNVEIEFNQNSSSVIVRNTGNVRYQDDLNISIGDEIVTLKLDLKIGEEKKYGLKAPNGNYDISVNSAAGTLFTGNAILTGKAVSIDSGNGIMIFEAYPLVWVFIAIILLIAGIVVFTKHKTRTIDYSRIRHKEKDIPIETLSSQTHEKRQFLDLAKPIVEGAESSLSMKGEKDHCSIVSVNMKNKSKLGANAQNMLNEIITQAKGNSGVVDDRGDHVLIIYSPLMTKTFKNELLATKAAMEIKEKLDAYNKKFNEKISYNLGVNSGDMISSVVKGKLNYTSLGNSIVLAKRISDLSSEKVLVSENIRQKLIRELKVNKFEHNIGNASVYEILRIADTEANQDKLRDLLKRTSFS